MKKTSVLAAGFALAFGLAVDGCPHANTGVSVQTAQFKLLAADGSETAGTTALTLTFDKAIGGLSAADITLTGPDGTDIVKGALSGAQPGAGGVVYTLSVSGITEDGTVTVKVAKAGYAFTPDTQTAEVSDPVAAQFLSLSVNDEEGEHTTALTLTFDRAIEGLSAADITFTGDTGIQAGALSEASAVEGGVAYALSVSGISKSGTVTAQVQRAGYIFSPDTQTVEVSASDKVQFLSLAADGPGTEGTTTLTLFFDKTIEGLSAADITLADTDSTGIQADALAGPSFGAGDAAYTLSVSGISKSGSVTAQVQKAGYIFSPESQSAKVYRAPAAATFVSLSADGSATAGTTALTLTFDKAVPGLSAADITLTGDTGIQAGALSGASAGAGGVAYTLSVNRNSIITQTGTVTVKVAKADYAFTPDTQSAEVHRTPGTATFLSLKADGTATAHTTALTLSFDKAVPGLSAADITLTDTSETGVVKGSLSAGAGGAGVVAYTLEVGEISKGGAVSVQVHKAGWTFAPDTLPAEVYVSDKVQFKSFAANGMVGGTAAARTTALTLAFDKAVAGLSAADIMLTDTGETGIVKGALAGPAFTAGSSAEGSSAEGTAGSSYVYTLSVSGVAKSGMVKARVIKGGYAFEPDTQSVEVYWAPAGVRFLSLSAEVGEGLSEDSSTTELRLAFSAPIERLSAADITLTDTGKTGIRTGVLRADEMSPGVYLLETSRIKKTGTVTVKVAKADYAFTPDTKTAEVNAGIIKATFKSVMTDKSPTGDSTPSLTLAFDSSVRWLVEADITLDDGGTGAQAGALKEVSPRSDGSALAYTLELHGIRKSGTVTVQVHKRGYVFTTSDTSPLYTDTAEQSARVIYEPYLFLGVWADGSPVGSGNATALGTGTLTLRFNRPVAELSADDITLEIFGTIIPAPLDKVSLSRGKPEPYGTTAYELKVREKTEEPSDALAEFIKQRKESHNAYAEYMINVRVTKEGYLFERDWLQVKVYPAGTKGEYASGTVNLLSVEENGSKQAGTTALTLIFDRELPHKEWAAGKDRLLKADDIVIYDMDGTGIVKGDLLRETENSGALRVDDTRVSVYVHVKKSGLIKVSLPKTLGGLTINDEDHYVEVYSGRTDATPSPANEVRFLSVSCDGGDVNNYFRTTTEVYLTFDKDVPYLSAADIVFSNVDDDGAQRFDKVATLTKGALKHTGPGKYTLSVQYKSQHAYTYAKVTVNAKNYVILPESRLMTLYWTKG